MMKDICSLSNRRRITPLIPGILSLLLLFSSSCQPSSSKEARLQEAAIPVEAVSQEKALLDPAYSIQEKHLQEVLISSKGLPDLTIEVRYPRIIGEQRFAFIDSLNTDFETRAATKLQELKATDPDMLDVLGERKSAVDSTHYVFDLAKARISIWKDRVLHLVQEEYVLTNEEQFLGMNKYECLAYNLASGRLLSTEEVFKPAFIQVLKPRAKELMEVNGVGEHWISTDLEYLQVDVRYLVLKEDGSFAYLYGVPIPHGRAIYEEIAFSPEEAKQLLNI